MEALVDSCPWELSVTKMTNTEQRNQVNQAAVFLYSAQIRVLWLDVVGSTHLAMLHCTALTLFLQETRTPRALLGIIVRGVGRIGTRRVLEGKPTERCTCIPSGAGF